MSQLDDSLVQRVDQLGPTKWSGTGYRYTTARREPLSGAGARLFGGRWNPPDIFATVYLATPQAACVAELRHVAQTQGTTAEEMLRADYLFHTIDVTDLNVLDLRTEQALAHVGLSLDNVQDLDWTICQPVGHAAWFLGLNGVLAPSATNTGEVLAAFEIPAAGHLSVTASVPFAAKLLPRLERNEYREYCELDHPTSDGARTT